jgi:hypothetical protein
MFLLQALWALFRFAITRLVIPVVEILEAGILRDQMADLLKFLLVYGLAVFAWPVSFIDSILKVEEEDAVLFVHPHLAGFAVKPAEYPARGIAGILAWDLALYEFAVLQ